MRDFWRREERLRLIRVSSLTMEIVFKSVVGDKVIDKDSLSIQNAVAHKRNEVAMVHSTDNLHLRSKLTVTLSATHGQLLHSYNGAGRQCPLVNFAESALA